MARHKDTPWCLPEGQPMPSGGRTHQWESIHAALLMDIRDELQRLNGLLHCANFIEIPGTLREIRRRLAPTRKLRKVA